MSPNAKTQTKKAIASTENTANPPPSTTANPLPSTTTTSAPAVNPKGKAVQPGPSGKEVAVKKEETPEEKEEKKREAKEDRAKREEIPEGKEEKKRMAQEDKVKKESDDGAIELSSEYGVTGRMEVAPITAITPQPKISPSAPVGSPPAPTPQILQVIKADHPPNDAEPKALPAEPLLQPAVEHPSPRVASTTSAEVNHFLAEHKYLTTTELNLPPLSPPDFFKGELADIVQNPIDYAVPSSISDIVTAELGKRLRGEEDDRAETEAARARTEETRARTEKILARTEEARARIEEARARTEEALASTEKISARLREMKAKFAIFEQQIETLRQAPRPRLPEDWFGGVGEGGMHCWKAEEEGSVRSSVL